MKLGFVSAILADFTFEEMIDCASEMGYQCTGDFTFSVASVVPE